MLVATMKLQVAPLHVIWLCTVERSTYAVNSGILQMLAQFCNGLPGSFELSCMLIALVPPSVQLCNSLQAMKPT